MTFVLSISKLFTILAIPQGRSFSPLPGKFSWVAVIRFFLRIFRQMNGALTAQKFMPRRRQFATREKNWTGRGIRQGFVEEL